MAINGSGLVAVGRPRAKKRLTAAQCIKKAEAAENVNGFKECFEEREPPETGLPCPVDVALDNGWEIHPDYKDAKRRVKLRKPYEEWRENNNTAVAAMGARVARADNLDIEDEDIKKPVSKVAQKEIGPNG